MLKDGLYGNIFRAAFKFGRRVHFVLQWKMGKPPIFSPTSELPVVRTDLIGMFSLCMGLFDLIAHTWIHSDTSPAAQASGAWKTSSKKVLVLPEGLNARYFSV